MDALTLAVSEVFRSLQGEGPDAGRPTTFLRLMGCNLHCSWCDTPYTWDGSRFDLRSETTMRDVQELATEIDESVGLRGLLDITGGEPLLQQDRIITLLHRLHTRPRISVETNGTIAPSHDLAVRVHRFNVSPKLSSSGNGDHPDLEVLKKFAYLANNYDQALFKFVVREPSDIDQCALLVHYADIENEHVWLMPEGQTPAELDAKLPWIAEAALGYGWSCSDRQHVRAFDDRRGR